MTTTKYRPLADGDFAGVHRVALESWRSSVRFADAEVERRASTTTLHGTIRSLAPLEALSVMLATTDLAHRLLPDGTILITSKPSLDEVR